MIVLLFLEILNLLVLSHAGSGSLAAMATFEDRFKPDMSVCSKHKVMCSNLTCQYILFIRACMIFQREEGIQLVRDAIAAGIFNDLVSVHLYDLLYSHVSVQSVCL